MSEFLKDLVTLKVVPCHRLESRSIVIGKRKFPICARCMAILMGYLAIPFLLFFGVHFPIIIGVLLNVPMLIDGYTQKWGWRKSNNFIRVITGLLSGIGVSIGIVSAAFDVSGFILQFK
ncbi:hypothetical protein D3C81_384770 [compost metagenome]